MIRLTAFLRDLFCLAHAHRSAGRASGGTYWPGKNPDTTERRKLAWLSRPIEAVCCPHRGGGWLFPSPSARPVLGRLIALQDHWSGQLWRRFNGQPGSFDQWVRDTILSGAAA